MSVKWDLSTIENQEAYLKSRAKGAYDLHLIAMYIKHQPDYACKWLNMLRKRGLC